MMRLRELQSLTKSKKRHAVPEEQKQRQRLIDLLHTNGGKGGYGDPPLPPKSTGLPVGEAAELLGMSQKTANQGLEVLDAIDSAIESGDISTAADLSAKVDDKGVAPVHRDISAEQEAEVEFDDRTPEQEAAQYIDGIVMTIRKNIVPTLDEIRRLGTDLDDCRERLDDIQKKLAKTRNALWREHGKSKASA